MTPTNFPEATVIAAGPHYLPLPMVVAGTPDGTICSCWKLTLWERIKLLFTGKVWLEVMTFHRGIPPSKVSVTKPDFTTYGYEE